MPQRIQRKRTKGWKMPDGVVYVGRPTKWGNPFTIKEHGPKMALALYGNVIHGLWSPILLADLSDEDYVRNYEAMQAMRGRLQNHPKEVAWMELKGRDLCCWCQPGDPCHADVLLEIVNAP